VPEWVKRRADYGLGGFVLYDRGGDSATDVKTLVASLRDTCGPIHIATDEEGGAVSRLGALSDELSTPGNYALGVVDDLAVTEDVAREIGGNLVDVGIDWDLAPAVDVAVNPQTPNGIRCFGNDRARVGEQAAAWIRGLQSAGVSGCAKHFPGHGMSGTDAHLGTPVIDMSRDEIVASYLDPFRAAIVAGVDSIMVSHDRLPRIDAVPSAISRPIIDGLLRRELGYDGVVITDALEMRGLRDVAPLEQAAVLALAAGADALCLGSWSFGADVDLAARAIVRAVNEGRLEASRLEEANARLASMERFASRASVTSPATADPRPSVAAASRAVEVTGQASTDAHHILVVHLDPENSPAAGSGPSDVSDYLTRSGVSVESVTMTEGRYAGEEMVSAITSDFREEYGKDGQIVIVVESPHRFGWQRELLRVFTGLAPDAIVLDVGFVEDDFSGFRGWIRTHSPSRVSASLAADIIMGSR
jgi:beta-N-acetylhexosaminidase